jgi:hypothetical protein
MVLYTDKSETFKCTIGVEGANISNTTVRLVFENKNFNMLFDGQIDPDGNCTVPIKKMKGILEEGEIGKMKLEVIADDTFFTPFEEDFSVETHRRVTIDVQEDKQITPIKENKVTVTLLNTNSIEPSSKDSQIISEILTSKGINKSNIKKNLSVTSKLVETYMKRFNVEISKTSLLDEVLRSLK